MDVYPQNTPMPLFPNKRKPPWTNPADEPRNKSMCKRKDDVIDFQRKMTAEEVSIEGDDTKLENGIEHVEDQNNVGEGEMTSTIPTDPVLVELMQRTGYTMIQENGQRKYGGPPPGWNNKSPPRGSEVFVGKIPRDVFEDELVPVFESVGKIYEMRLMMEFDGKNRGYAFVMYTTKQDAKMAVKKLNNYEIRKGRLLGVCCSVDNCRLFVGGIPKTKKKDEIFAEMKKITEGVMDVIVYPSASDKTKNRGFAFVEYDSHRAAAMARRKLIPGRIQLWGHPIAVDWAEPEQEVDQDIMDQVKVLYVRNLMLDTTEDKIQDVFSQYHSGTVERVKKIRDYAFVHFTSREACLHAMNMLNETQLDGTEIEVTLAKPVDKNDYNRLAKVGAKALGGNVLDPVATTPMVQTGVANQNAMVVYPAGIPGVYNSDLTAYYPLGQYNLQTQTTRGIYPTRTPTRGRGRGAAGGRASASRSSYLGYSAGKATYGRYYAKNNQDKAPIVDINGNIIEMATNPQQTNGLTVYKQPATVGQIAVSQTAQPQSYVTYGNVTSPVMAGMQPTVGVTAAAPVTTAPSAVAVLEDICVKNLWGAPTYQLLATTGPEGMQLYLYKVSIPALASLYPQQPYYQPNKLCTSIDEAKVYAAEYVLSQLSLQLDPGVQMIIPQGQQAGVQLQSVYAAPNGAITGAVRGQTSPNSIPSTAMVGQQSYVPVTTPSPTIPMSFVDPMAMQPIAVMYQ